MSILDCVCVTVIMEVCGFEPVIHIVWDQNANHCLHQGSISYIILHLYDLFSSCASCAYDHSCAVLPFHSLRFSHHPSKTSNFLSFWGTHSHNSQDRVMVILKFCYYCAIHEKKAPLFNPGFWQLIQQILNMGQINNVSNPSGEKRKNQKIAASEL